MAGELRRLRGAQALEGGPAGGHRRGPGPGSAPDAPRRHRGRPPPPAGARHPPRRRRRAPGGPRRAGLHRRSAEPPVGHRPGLRPDPRRRRLRVLHRRRVQPADRRLARRGAHAHQHGARRTGDGPGLPRDAPGGPRGPQRRRQPVRLAALERTPRRDRRRRRRSAASATATTTPSPRPPTASTRPNSPAAPPAGPGAPSATSNPPPSPGCTGTTTSASTATSETSPRQSSRPPTLPDEPTTHWLETNKPSLHQTQGDSSADTAQLTSIQRRRRPPRLDRATRTATPHRAPAQPGWSRTIPPDRNPAGDGPTPPPPRQLPRPDRRSLRNHGR